jgi:hypothetical protein
VALARGRIRRLLLSYPERVRFLSDEWLAALGRAAETIDVDPDVSVVIEQTVRSGGGDHEDVTWHTTVAGGRVEVSPGPSSIAAIRLSSDAETAWQIAGGRLSAQRAFLDGRLRLGGDVRSLMAARPALDAIADAFSGVRAETRSPV